MSTWLNKTGGYQPPRILAKWWKWQPTAVFLPRKSHGQRSLADYSLWGHRVGQDWAAEHTCNGQTRRWEWNSPHPQEVQVRGWDWSASHWLSHQDKDNNSSEWPEHQRSREGHVINTSAMTGSGGFLQGLGPKWEACPALNIPCHYE